jgi:SAM-dependent methyltransferase
MDERDSGPYSGASPMDYDAELRLLNDVLRRAYGIERHDQVLDIGCGAGQTTREAARMAAEGGALGLDLSVEAIGRARELAQAGGVRNATFVHADAQVHPFPSERFDLAISRFGTMFFLDPVAAFANIGRALRPAGRLVTMVWQGHEQNEWSLAIEEALGASSDEPASEAPKLDDWVRTYNTDRPHSALGMATPASRFTPTQAGPPADDSALLGERTGAAGRSF